MKLKQFVFLSILATTVIAKPAFAFQSHPEPEGLFIHQISHGLFMFTMLVLAYWLEKNRFTAERGWRLIQVGCVLFAIWNINTFVGHWVEEQVPDASLIGEPDWTQRLIMSSPLVYAYYFFKLDHLVCVPAVLCLFFGIRSLYLQVLKSEQAGGD